MNVQVDQRLNSFAGDERKFKQILLNLLSNAVKFTPEGGRIAVAAQPIEQGVQVSVSDTGIGIAPEHQETVFEAFHQVGTETRRSAKARAWVWRWCASGRNARRQHLDGQRAGQGIDVYIHVGGAAMLHEQYSRRRR